jgi:hypothetical protein
MAHYYRLTGSCGEDHSKFRIVDNPAGVKIDEYVAAMATV